MIRFKYNFSKEKENNMFYINEKGITMVAIIITVIVLLILAGVSINVGLNGMESVENSKLASELNMVQHAVLQQYTKYKTTKDISYIELGQKITQKQANQYAEELGVTLVNIPDTYSNKDYYLLDKESLSSIGIQDSNYEYIINYISGEVMNITIKKTSNNSPLYIKANSFNKEE